MFYTDSVHANPNTYLSYDLLEDVMLLPSSQYERICERATVFRIGPLIEYAYHDYQSLESQLRSRSNNPTVNSVLHAIANHRSSTPDTTIHARPVEFARAPHTQEGIEDPNWIAFCLRIVDAGVRAGLSKLFAQALVGTLEEMCGNIVDHSQRELTGLVGYAWRRNEFEYVVADAGIGVLRSLRQHPDYSFLADSGQALETAISDGESCHGRNQHRGMGFSRLVFNIAQRNSYLRFRSGDHSYSIDGTLTIPLRRTAPCAPFEGFLISVISKTTNSPKRA